MHPVDLVLQSGGARAFFTALAEIAVRPPWELPPLVWQTTILPALWEEQRFGQDSVYVSTQLITEARLHAAQQGLHALSPTPQASPPDAVFNDNRVLAADPRLNDRSWLDPVFPQRAYGARGDIRDVCPWWEMVDVLRREVRACAGVPERMDEADTPLSRLGWLSMALRAENAPAHPEFAHRIPVFAAAILLGVSMSVVPPLQWEGWDRIATGGRADTLLLDGPFGPGDHRPGIPARQLFQTDTRFARYASVKQLGWRVFAPKDRFKNVHYEKEARSMAGLNGARIYNPGWRDPHPPPHPTLPPPTPFPLGLFLDQGRVWSGGVSILPSVLLDAKNIEFPIWDVPCSVLIFRLQAEVDARDGLVGERLFFRFSGGAALAFAVPGGLGSRAVLAVRISAAFGSWLSQQDPEVAVPWLLSLPVATLRAATGLWFSIQQWAKGAWSAAWSDPKWEAARATLRVICADTHASVTVLPSTPAAAVQVAFEGGWWHALRVPEGGRWDPDWAAADGPPLTLSQVTAYSLDGAVDDPVLRRRVSKAEAVVRAMALVQVAGQGQATGPEWEAIAASLHEDAAAAFLALRVLVSMGRLDVLLQAVRTGRVEARYVTLPASPFLEGVRQGRWYWPDILPTRSSRAQWVLSLTALPWAASVEAELRAIWGELPVQERVSATWVPGGFAQDAIPPEVDRLLNRLMDDLVSSREGAGVMLEAVGLVGSWTDRRSAETVTVPALQRGFSALQRRPWPEGDVRAVLRFASTPDRAGLAALGLTMLQASDARMEAVHGLVVWTTSARVLPTARTRWIFAGPLAVRAALQAYRLPPLSVRPELRFAFAQGDGRGSTPGPGRWDAVTPMVLLQRQLQLLLARLVEHGGHERAVVELQRLLADSRWRLKTWAFERGTLALDAFQRAAALYDRFVARGGMDWALASAPSPDRTTWSTLDAPKALGGYVLNTPLFSRPLHVGGRVSDDAPVAPINAVPRVYIPVWGGVGLDVSREVTCVMSVASQAGSADGPPEPDPLVQVGPRQFPRDAFRRGHLPLERVDAWMQGLTPEMRVALARAWKWSHARAELVDAVFLPRLRRSLVPVWAGVTPDDASRYGHTPLVWSLASSTTELTQVAGWIPHITPTGEAGFVLLLPARQRTGGGWGGDPPATRLNLLDLNLSSVVHQRGD